LREPPGPAARPSPGRREEAPRARPRCPRRRTIGWRPRAPGFRATARCPPNATPRPSRPAMLQDRRLHRRQPRQIALKGEPVDERRARRDAADRVELIAQPYVVVEIEPIGMLDELDERLARRERSDSDGASVRGR